MANTDKRVGITLDFSANTTNAKAELNKLQKQLQEVISASSRSDRPIGLTKEYREASEAAAALAVNLKKATDVNTNKLDLTKFSYQLKQGKIDIADYAKKLTAIGPEGKQAFLTLANAIQSAEQPLTKTSALVTKLTNSFKQALTYQFNNTAIRALTGAISGAYNYAQDLNESLNNIRIVTGQSTEQMARFAEKANKAAQSLSTTTTAYTDASLIYYQQGKCNF